MHVGELLMKIKGGGGNTKKKKTVVPQEGSHCSTEQIKLEKSSSLPAHQWLL